MTVKLSHYKEVNLKVPVPHAIAVYGKPMSGKTTFVGKMERPLFLSFDKNAKRAGYNAEVPNSYEDTIAYIEQAEGAGYKTIAIDTAEDMASMLENNLLDKYHADNLKTANGGYGAGYSEFNHQFKTIVDELTKSNLQIVYLLRATETDEGLEVVLKEKLFNIIGGYSDGLIEINEQHEAKWKKKRYDWAPDQLKAPLDNIIDPEKEKQKKLEALGL